MNKLKELTTKQKAVIGVSLIIILAAITVGLILSFNKENEVIEETPEVKEVELELTLDYKQELEDEYTFELEQSNDELSSDETEVETKLTIKTEDIQPEIDTSLIGKTEHVVELEDVKVKLTVIVEDNREIVLDGETEFTVDVGLSQEDLEKNILDSFVSDDVEEDDQLEFDFEYPENFDLNEEGEYTVTLQANFVNNVDNKTAMKSKFI